MTIKTKNGWEAGIRRVDGWLTTLRIAHSKSIKMTMKNIIVTLNLVYGCNTGSLSRIDIKFMLDWNMQN
jgi:hypothetical protein